MSLIPDMDGSATINTISTPLKDAITGQPIPGDPSIIANSTSADADFICFFTSVTNIPEVPLPIFSCAVENTFPHLYITTVHRLQQVLKSQPQQGKQACKPRSLHRQKDLSCISHLLK